MRLAGITGETHARREGLYQAAQNVYRRKSRNGRRSLLPAYGSLVLYAGVLSGTGQAGDIVDWDEPTRTIELSEPFVFDPAAAGHSLTLVRDDGSIHPPIVCLPGLTENELVLGSVPDVELVVDDADRERPKSGLNGGPQRAPGRLGDRDATMVPFRISCVCIQTHRR